MPKLVEIGIDALFEALRDIEHRALIDLMVSLLRRNAYSLDDFLQGVHSKTDSLEDLRYSRCNHGGQEHCMCPSSFNLKGST